MPTSVSLSGGEFVDAMAAVCDRWGSSVSDVLELFTWIDPDVEILQLVARLRGAGIRTCLASNQQPHRAARMSDVIGYRDAFDDLFYSCTVGAAKPDREFFTRVVDQLGLPAAGVLFMDDHEPNVLAARAAGLHAERVHVDWGASGIASVLADYGLRC